MTRTIKILTAFAIIISMSSFKGSNINEFTGTYGTCASDPSQIKLIINSDHTFYYQDLSVSDKKIIVKGSWILKDKKVLLKSDNPDKKFHNTWTFPENGQIARSRKGLAFYRLGK